MFKRSFIGYSKASLNQVKAFIDQQANEQKEQIETSLNAAIAEQVQLSEEFQSVTVRLAEARSSTILAEKFQKNIVSVIGEVRASLDGINARRMQEADSFCREIDGQVALLDEEINQIKQKIKTLVQGIADVSESVKYNEKDQEDLKSGFMNIMHEFSLQAEDSEESGVSTEILKLKDLNYNQAPLVIEEELPEENHGVVESVIAQPDQGVPLQPIVQEEVPDRKFFDQMKKSLEHSASTYTKLKEEVVISEEDKQYALRAQRFFDQMRQYWLSSPPLKAAPQANPQIPIVDDQYIIQAERFLESMRGYWRSSPVKAESESDAGNSQYLKQAEKFLDNMRLYWRS